MDRSRLETGTDPPQAAHALPPENVLTAGSVQSTSVDESEREVTHSETQHHPAVIATPPASDHYIVEQQAITDSNASRSSVQKRAPSNPVQNVSNAGKQPRFEITSWKPVIYWSWRLNDDTCAICKRSIDVICMYCFVDFVEDRQCMIVTGQCGHAFHEHCIDVWLKRSQTCPLDNKAWEDKLVLSHGAYSDLFLNKPEVLRNVRKVSHEEDDGTETEVPQQEGSSQDQD